MNYKEKVKRKYLFYFICKRNYKKKVISIFLLGNV